ncbi:hypothetical protein BJV78DRAFT_1154690 [Lactifluus subvellereus]|nr:hypothetical protein BJV78DRAFT_1154690 [Lactifluus subvellereus]
MARTPIQAAERKPASEVYPLIAGMDAVYSAGFQMFPSGSYVPGLFATCWVIVEEPLYYFLGERTDLGALRAGHLFLGPRQGSLTWKDPKSSHLQAGNAQLVRGG